VEKKGKGTEAKKPKGVGEEAVKTSRETAAKRQQRTHRKKRTPTKKTGGENPRAASKSHQQKANFLLCGDSTGEKGV